MIPDASPDCNIRRNIPLRDGMQKGQIAPQRAKNFAETRSSVGCGGSLMLAAVRRTVRRAALVMARRAVVECANEHAEDDDGKNRGRKPGASEDRVARGISRR